MSELSNKDVLVAAEALAPIFADAGWTWLGNKNPPTALELESFIHSMLRNLRDPVDGKRRISSGRITVMRHTRTDSSSHEEIRLECAVIISGKPNRILL